MYQTLVKLNLINWEFILNKIYLTRETYREKILNEILESFMYKKNNYLLHDIENCVLN
jgi:hypothetical protein